MKKQMQKQRSLYDGYGHHAYAYFNLVVPLASAVSMPPPAAQYEPSLQSDRPRLRSVDVDSTTRRRTLPITRMSRTLKMVTRTTPTRTTIPEPVQSADY